MDEIENHLRFHGVDDNVIKPVIATIKEKLIEQFWNGYNTGWEDGASGREKLDNEQI